MSQPPMNPEETRAYRIGQVAALDFVLQRLRELQRELSEHRASLILPRRRPDADR